MPFTEDTIAKYLQDPLSFPPEFKSWFVKYLEQHQPSLQAGLLAGKLPTSKLTGQIPYSQLTLANSIVSGDIVDGTIVNADINTAAAIALSKLADPTTGKVIGSAGSAAAAVFPPGYEYTRIEFTGNVTSTVVAPASAPTVVTATAVTFDGSTPIWVEFSAPQVNTGLTAGCGVAITIWDGTTDLGVLAFVQNNAASASATSVPMRQARLLTPSAASHTYAAKTYALGAAGTVIAGTGGTGNYMPGYIKVTKA